MNSDDNIKDEKKDFEPLQIMGIFWFLFGLIVLFASFFVKDTADVPLLRGIITNITAGILLLGAGIFSILKGKHNKRRKALKAE